MTVRPAERFDYVTFYMEPYRFDDNCSLGTAPRTVDSTSKDSLTGDSYLEITSAMGTDVTVWPNTAKAVITLVTTDRLLASDYCLLRKVESSFLQCVTFCFICIRLTDSSHVCAATAVVYCITSVREQTFGKLLHLKPDPNFGVAITNSFTQYCTRSRGY